MSTARVVVLIETRDRVFYRTWTGSSIDSIRKAARSKYAVDFPGARVSFGVGVYTNSYGAH